MADRDDNAEICPLVGDKLQTKMIAEKVGINLLGQYRKNGVPHEVQAFLSNFANRAGFFGKPAQGSAAGEILVIGRMVGHLCQTGIKVMSIDDVRQIIILFGLLLFSRNLIQLSVRHFLLTKIRRQRLRGLPT